MLGKFVTTVFALSLLLPLPLSAQSFGDAELAVSTPEHKGVEGLDSVIDSEKNSSDKSAASAEDIEKDKTSDSASQNEDEIFIPDSETNILNRPTIDGTKRGGAAFIEVDDKGIEHPADGKIFMYIKDLKIYRSISGLTSCDVSIFIITNLDQRLVSFDAKLVWPGLTTAVSFANVSPNTQTYYNYTLMGDGCYSLDKFPNIVVNRCRVKGLSSAACASRITWLQEQKR